METLDWTRHATRIFVLCGGIVKDLQSTGVKRLGVLVGKEPQVLVEFRGPGTVVGLDSPLQRVSTTLTSLLVGRVTEDTHDPVLRTQGLPHHPCPVDLDSCEL